MLKRLPEQENGRKDHGYSRKDQFSEGQAHEQSRQKQKIHQVKKIGERTFPNSAKQMGNTQEKIHPSWEAKKKLKEQEANIHVFQGQKVTFDSD